MMDAVEAVTGRKSIRAYEDRPIPMDALTRIIEAGQWAPNAGSTIAVRGLQLLPAPYPFQISVITNASLGKGSTTASWTSCFMPTTRCSDKERLCPGISLYTAHRC